MRSQQSKNMKNIAITQLKIYHNGRHVTVPVAFAKCVISLFTEGLSFSFFPPDLHWKYAALD